MSKSTGVVERLAAALRSLGIKAPWKYTGPVSSPEYQSHLPKAVDYRRFAPATAPIRPAVPQAEPERVYDIKYYTRDTRRAELRGGSKHLERSTVDPRAEEGGAAAAAEPITPGKPFRYAGKLRSIVDNDNNGYTI